MVSPVEQALLVPVRVQGRALAARSRVILAGLLGEDLAREGVIGGGGDTVDDSLYLIPDCSLHVGPT